MVSDMTDIIAGAEKNNSMLLFSVIPVYNSPTHPFATHFF